MREIKFRAWDKNTERMWDIETWHIADEYVNLIEPVTSTADINAERFWRKQSEIILMQYTGLKDKNGVEIYEGDIVKLHVVILSPDDKVGEIKYSPAYGYSIYFTSNRMARQEYWSTGGKHTIEVIGNIHENADLLEG